jgi:quinol monooxygenase YgiN
MERVDVERVRRVGSLLTAGCQDNSAGQLDRQTSLRLPTSPMQGPSGREEKQSVADNQKQASWLSPVIELRQYDLLPGMRETLIDIFDTHFIESQEAEGMAVIGQFRDLDNPDSFVWLRGFADMETRKQALESFYSGPVWMRHRDAANATMTRFDNVLLLRPATPDSGFSLDVADRPAPGAAGDTGSLVTINIIAVRGDAAEFAGWHRENMLPIFRDAGAQIIGAFVTENAENNYPALPVRTDKQVLIILTRFADAAALDRFRATLARSTEWAAASKAADFVGVMRLYFFIVAVRWLWLEKPLR